MRKNNLTKAIAATLAATMVLGSTMVAFAADNNTGTLNAEGTVDGLVNLDVVSVEVPTSRSDIFAFTLDPQGLIQKSIASGSTKSDDVNATTYPANKASTLYFANIATPAVPAVAAADATAVLTKVDGSSATATVSAAASVVNGSYIYKEGTDKYWKTDDPAPTEDTLDAGWYAADTNFGTSEAGVSKPSTATIAGVTLGGTPKSGDTLVTTAKVEAADAVPATYTHSGTSDELVAVNKSFVDVNVTMSAAVTGLGDAITMAGSDADVTAATTASKPVIYLDIIGQDGANNAKDVAIGTGKTFANLYDVVTKNDFDDFNVSYDSTAKAYNVVKDSTDFTEYKFKLTGKTSTKGWTTSLASAAPKVALTWKFQKKAAATVAITSGAVATISNLPTDGSITVTDLLVSSVEGGEKAMTNYKGSYVGTNKIESDGQFEIALGDIWKEYFSGNKVVAIAVLSDGTTCVSPEVTLATVSQ